jgi:hypothetical protein
MIENTDNEWKNEAPILAGLKKPVIDEPGEAYFSALHNSILQRIKSAEEWETDASLLVTVEKPFIQVPGNEYFNELPGHIIEKSLANQELVAEAPILASLKKPGIEPPYEGYFNELPSTILNRIHKEDAPVVRLIPMVVRYAAIAACMAGTLFMYKGLIDSDFVPSLAVHKNVLFESDFNNMPELYDADELAVYLAEESAPVVEKNPMVDELDKTLDNHDDLESLLDITE